MYLVVLEKHAQKTLKKLPKIYLKKVVQQLDALALNPFLGQKMAGQFQGSYRIKIPPIRIIYTPDTKNKIIFIRAIGFRGGVYK